MMTPMGLSRWLSQARETGYTLPLLAHGLFGEDFVDQQRGALGHAPGTATGAETPPLAAMGDQVLGMTGLAAHP